MENSEAVIDGLKQAIELERRTAELFQKAEQKARTDEHAHILHAMHERHHDHARRLDARREELQKLEGEGWLGEAIESIGDAIADIVGGLPGGFIEGTTTPPLDTLRRLEHDLIALYEGLHPAADAETKTLLERHIEECNTNLNRLTAMDA